MEREIWVLRIGYLSLRLEEFRMKSKVRSSKRSNNTNLYFFKQQ